MEKPKDVEAYIRAKEEHSEKLIQLRDLILKYPFKETIKWGMPTYVYRNRNLVGIGAFKKHVGVWFFQGALLEDAHGILRNAQEGKTKAMRQLHYGSEEEIDEEKLNNYLRQTIENEDKGIFVKFDRDVKSIGLPPELKAALNMDAELQDSFNSLTPGKQKDYAQHIGSAKRDDTRARRLRTIIPMIRQGKGLNDKYKN